VEARQLVPVSEPARRNRACGRVEPVTPAARAESERRAERPSDPFPGGSAASAAPL